MIRITLLDGPYAGRVRTFDGQWCREVGEEMDPSTLFESFTRHGWDWSVDYGSATEEETLLWFRVEFATRAIRALRAGRPVFFLGRKFEAEEKEDVLEVAGRLEDEIVASGRVITIDSDDETGLVIGVRGYEQ